MIGEAQRRTRRNGLIAIVLAALLAFGVGLVVLGGDDGSGGESAPPTTATDQTDSSVESQPPLAIDDVSMAGVAELTGLALGDEVTGFLTASAEDQGQLDVTFALPAGAVEAFVAGSDLPDPVDGERVVQHSSPLWKLTPDEDTTFSSTTDERDGLRRSVEFIDGADGTVVVRATFTTA